MILVKNILKKYDNKKVVNDVSVNIEKGKITSFIGPNGAGKSTLLSIITRLMKRDLGEVYIEGKEIYDTIDERFWEAANSSRNRIYILR